MSNNLRTININYFKLEPDVAGEGEYRQAALRLRNFIRNIDAPNLRPIPKADGWISMTSLHRRPAFWAGVISKIQTKDIPNKRNPNNPTPTPIDIDDEEGLDHPTCFILDKSTNILAIESIKTGVTANTFCEFLSEQVGFSVLATIIPMEDSRQRYEQMRRFKRLSFKFARRERLTNNVARSRTSAGKAMDIADATGTAQIFIELGMGRSKDLLSYDGIRGLVQGLLDSDDIELQSVQVYGSRGFQEGESFEPVDLVEQRIFDQIRVNRVRLQTEAHIQERLWAVADKYDARRDTLNDYQIRE